MLTRLLTILSTLVLALSVHALSTTLQGEPSVRLESLDGSRVSVPLLGMEVKTMGASPARMDFFAVKSNRAVPAPRPGSFELTLHNGDHVLGEIALGSEESLALQLSGGASAEFAIEEIASLYSVGHVQDQSVLPAPESGDRLWRITPGGFDPLDGFLLGFDASGVSMEGDLGERLTPWTEVACLWIEALEGASFAPRTADVEGRSPVAVDLVDGSRLRGYFGGIGEGLLRLERTGRAGLKLALSTITHVAVDDDRQSFLSDRKWTEAGSLSLFGDGFGMRWPALGDKAVSGGRLRAGGREWARGLGVHAPSQLQFGELSGGVLRGAVAVDDSVLGVPAKGSVTFQVILDGKIVWSSPELTSGEAPLALPAIKIGDAKTLELKVDVASDSFMGDRADWLEMRIVKP